MSNREGRRQINVELPIESIEALKEEKRRTGQSLWELLDQGARVVAEVDDSTEQSIERRIENLSDEEDRLEEELIETQEELQRVQEKRKAAEEKLAELREQQDTIEELFIEIISTLQENPNRNIYSCRSTLDEIATREYGRPTESNVENVISDVREYCRENDVDLEDRRLRATNTVYSQPQAPDGGERFLHSLDGDDD
jgi:uncharacterized coiled-coil DUF342 family protein